MKKKAFLKFMKEHPEVSWLIPMSPTPIIFGFMIHAFKKKDDFMSVVTINPAKARAPYHRLDRRCQAQTLISVPF